MTIKIKGMSKTVDDLLILNDIDLIFEKNKIYGLFGQNDSGKSTLLRVIANLRFPSEGYIEIDGKDTAEYPANTSKIYIQTHDKVYPKRATLKQIKKWMSEFYTEFDTSNCNKLMERSGLKDSSYFNRLELNERVLFRNCLSMSLDVDYLLLDEPGFSLDATHRALFYQDMKDSMKRSEKTIILSTHTIDEVEKIIDDVVILETGQVLVAGKVEDVVNETFSVEGEERDVREFLQKKEMLGQEYHNGRIKAYVKAQPKELLGFDNLTVESLSLQELFISLTRSDFGETGETKDE